MDSNKELIEALNQIEKEKDISKDILLEAIENSLLAACKNQYGKSDNIKVTINRDTGAFAVYAEKEIVEEVEDPVLQISPEEAAQKFPKKKYAVGDIVNIEVTPKNFGRIAAQKAKQVVVQKIREEERKVLYNQYFEKERDIVTGIVQRYVGENVSINLGKVDAVLTKNEQIAGEHFRPTERIKLYVVEVKDTTKGPKITVSRTHPELVKRLFEAEVTEVRDGVVEIRSISREAGARTKMAVTPAQRRTLYVIGGAENNLYVLCLRFLAQCHTLLFRKLLVKRAGKQHRRREAGGWYAFTPSQTVAAP